VSNVLNYRQFASQTVVAPFGSLLEANAAGIIIGRCRGTTASKVTIAPGQGYVHPTARSLEVPSARSSFWMTTWNGIRVVAAAELLNLWEDAPYLFVSSCVPPPSQSWLLPSSSSSSSLSRFEQVVQRAVVVAISYCWGNVRAQQYNLPLDHCGAVGTQTPIQIQTLVTTTSLTLL
jgi:hypothetical protein